jgi:hypothetical protein
MTLPRQVLFSRSYPRGANEIGSATLAVNHGRRVVDPLGPSAPRFTRGLAGATRP